MNETLYYAGILNDAKDLQNFYESNRTDTETFAAELKMLSRIRDNAVSAYIKLGNPFRVSGNFIEISIEGVTFSVSLSNVKSSLQKEFDRLSEINEAYLKTHESIDVKLDGFPLKTKTFLNSATKAYEIAISKQEYEEALKAALEKSKEKKSEIKKAEDDTQHREQAISESRDFSDMEEDDLMELLGLLQS